MQMNPSFASVAIDPDVTKEFLLFAIIQAAGWPIWWLLIASVIATALIIERLVYLRRARIFPPQLLQEVIRVYHNSKINDDVLTNLASNSPLGKVLAAGLRNVDAPREIMIEIFGATNRAGADPAQLGHGISVALYNTGFGLTIAMPALIFYRHFRALVDGFIVDMEQQAVKFVDTVHRARK